MIPSGKLRVLLILFLSSSLSNGMSTVDSTVAPFAMGNKPRKFSLGGIVDRTTRAGRGRRESGHGDLHTFLHWTISEWSLFTTTAKVGCDGGSFVVAYLRNLLSTTTISLLLLFIYYPLNETRVAPEEAAAAELPAATTELPARETASASHLQLELENQNQKHQPQVQQIDSGQQ
ncbi:hypothetical protein NC652_041492 [Populus alba x Populus x berolinensis]|nr:hypothetical protein NC652_041492 [Populus alba x Populus x berolinensis]